MPHATPSQQHDFDGLLDARLGQAVAPQPAAPSKAAPSPQVHQALFGMQEGSTDAADTPAADLAELYEADGRSTPPAPRAPGSDLEMVAAELDLTSDLTLEDLSRIRRDFALANHPDRVAPALSDHATRRMTSANTLIDQALKRKRNQPA